MERSFFKWLLELQVDIEVYTVTSQASRTSPCWPRYIANPH